MTQATPETPELQRRLDHAATQIAYAGLPLSLAFTLGLSAVFGVIMAPFFPRGAMLAWVGAIQLTGLARLGLWYAHRRAAPGLETGARWSHLFLLGSILAAATWSLGALALRATGGHAEVAALCVALLGVSAFALTSMAASFRSLLAFLVTALAPMAASLLLAELDVERLVGALLLTALLALAWSGRQSSQALRGLLRVELELQAAIAATRTAQAAAEQASVAKSRFLATMSHEVRTPLNGILGLAELLERGALEPRQRRQLGLLRQSGENLRGIVDDVLDFSRIESGQMEILSEPIEPRRLVGELLELWLPRARSAGLELRLVASPDLPWQVRGDPRRLVQVLNNFIGNALKFTENGSVELRIDLDQHVPPVAGRSARLRFAVRDTGIGIAADALERIFEPFTQVDDSSSRRFGGAGLGLAICRRLVRLMGGMIGVDSAPGQGSTFWASLPMEVVALDAPTRPATARRADAPGAGETTPPGDGADDLAQLEADPLRRLEGRVLVVEDNAVNRAVCTAMLERLGVEYDEAVDGLEALERAVDGVYDLVLMDCQMPRLDGLEATRRLRTRAIRARRGARLPIVALTANAFDDDRERARAAGMDGFLAKPVALADLHDAMAAWLPGAGAPAAAPAPTTDADPTARVAR